MTVLIYVEARGSVVCKNDFEGAASECWIFRVLLVDGAEFSFQLFD